MRLYHVSYEINNCKKRVFIPRVPSSIADGENNNIPRICLSDSVSRCIQAIQVIPNKGELLSIYTTDINTRYKKLITPNELVRFGYVVDATVNHEYWYTDKLEMTNKVYRVNDIDIEFTYAWEVCNIESIIYAVNKTLQKFNINLLSKVIKHLKSLKTAKGVYEAFNKYLCNIENYCAYDYFDDIVAEIPFIQLKKVTKLKLERV